MSIYLPPEGETIALPPMAPASKKAKTSKRKTASTSRPRKDSSKKGKKTTRNVSKHDHDHTTKMFVVLALGA